MTENFFASVQEQQQNQMKKIETEQHAGDDVVVFSLRMPAEMRRQLRMVWTNTGESMNKQILRAIETQLKNEQ